MVNLEYPGHIQDVVSSIDLSHGKKLGDAGGVAVDDVCSWKGVKNLTVDGVGEKRGERRGGKEGCGYEYMNS